jgi:peptide/nickel transport system ATP-binding protein
MNDQILQIKDLSTYFNSEQGRVTAVNHVSFSLTKGKITGIVGESGSGKSVTSLSIMRLISKHNGFNEGEIILNDSGRELNLLTLSEAEMNHYRGNKIAMIFQEPMTSLNPVYTCGDQVSETIRLHQKTDKATARSRTIELFKEVQLPRPEQLFDSYPHQLSGGQKQRVMIAMALSCNPEILIADEPTTALDVTVQKTILELLKRICSERQMTMIFISHDLGVISELCDEVMVMYKGNIVEQGDAINIFSSPKHPYTKGLLACRPSLSNRMKRLPVVSDFMQTNTDGTVIENNYSITEIIKKNSLSDEDYSARKKMLYSQSPVLEVKNLQTYFLVRKGIFGKIVDHVKAVDDVSFTVFPGETLGLVGESGCGKTTLGRSILRLIEPTSGEIIFKEKMISDLDKDQMREMRKDMQIIFQDPYSSLNPRLTIGAAIMEPMQVHHVLNNDRARKDKVIELLEKVGLRSDYFDRYPHEFSGGQRQRICIARALSLNPEFIICDESVSALDVSVQAQVLNLLSELRDELNLTYIFISHDLSVVKHISDRMVVMNKGKIVEIGDPEEIYANPKEEYTRKLIDAIPGKLKANSL